MKIEKKLSLEKQSIVSVFLFKLFNKTSFLTPKKKKKNIFSKILYLYIYNDVCKRKKRENKILIK